MHEWRACCWSARDGPLMQMDGADNNLQLILIAIYNTHNKFMLHDFAVHTGI